MKYVIFFAMITVYIGMSPTGCGDDSKVQQEDTTPPWQGAATYQSGPSFVAHADASVADIPQTAIDVAKQNLHIVYQHTSHGSQLITGMSSLMNFAKYSNLYNWSDDGTAGLDLDDNGIAADCSDLSTGDSIDENGDTPWVIGTRVLLDEPANAHVNVVMWSWCSISGHNAQRYVDNMEKLIDEYPNVHFVFMTGHAEGGGEDMTQDGVHYNNQLIRDHCRTNSRWLYDFADIEAHNPDGNYYWSANMRDNLDYDGGNWAVEWTAANPGHDFSLLADTTSDCAHSGSPAQANLNCVQKAAAAWHLFARLGGWNPSNK